MATLRIKLPRKSAATALFDAATIIEQLAPKNRYYVAKVREMRDIAAKDVDAHHAIAEVLDYCEYQEGAQEHCEIPEYGATLSSKSVRKMLTKRRKMR